MQHTLTNDLYTRRDNRQNNLNRPTNKSIQEVNQASNKPAWLNQSLNWLKRTAANAKNFFKSIFSGGNKQL
jgi:hypothetical protein